ncbi:uncharacterized protein LOC105696674 [Orussus abietinus]|uniref:uncharacterized protein LOC105696674 n=1 Tax=Orussus abietinus TaxID=222816 RepID=UPI000625E8BD|nr:uncharacterized protein LOC105696674 [Orussus abietinus]
MSRPVISPFSQTNIKEKTNGAIKKSSQYHLARAGKENIEKPSKRLRFSSELSAEFENFRVSNQSRLTDNSNSSSISGSGVSRKSSMDLEDFERIQSAGKNRVKFPKTSFLVYSDGDEDIAQERPFCSERNTSKKADKKSKIRVKAEQIGREFPQMLNDKVKRPKTPYRNEKDVLEAEGRCQERKFHVDVSRQKFQIDSQGIINEKQNLRCNEVESKKVGGCKMKFPHPRVNALQGNTKCDDASEKVITPIDAYPIPQVPNQVKLLRKKDPKSLRAAVMPYAQEMSIDMAYTLEYIDDIVHIQMQKDDLLNSRRCLRRSNISAQQKSIIINYLVRINTHCFYPSFILYQTVMLFLATLNTKPVKLSDLQLIALASLWIVLKREYIYRLVPSSKTVISLAKDLYEERKDLLVQCEREILISLNFDIVFPDPFAILSYHLVRYEGTTQLRDDQVEFAYYCGSYLIDVSLFEEILREKTSTLLGIVAAQTAIFATVASERELLSPRWTSWRSPILNKFPDREIQKVRALMIAAVMKSKIAHTAHESVFKKYNRSRYGGVSRAFIQKVEVLAQSETQNS